MLQTLLSLYLAAGPTIDPIDGSTVTAADRDLLPSGRSAASVMDTWLGEAVSLYSVEGGIGLFDRPHASARGWSWTQLEYTLDGLDVTDPARPGAPLIELPHSFWQSTHLQSFWTDAPTVAWQLAPAGELAEVKGRASWGRALNGPTLVPSGFMDREPAVPFGAVSDRRSLTNGVEVDARAAADGVTAAVEHVAHTHTYPTLLGDDGRRLDDHASRTTALLGLDTAAAGRPIRLTGLYQRQTRTYAGAEYRLPAAMTLDSAGDAVLLQATAELYRADELRLDAAVGWGWRSDTTIPHGGGAWVSDLENQWQWLHRPVFGEELSRRRLDAVVTAHLDPDLGLELQAEGSAQSLSSRRQVPRNVTAVTFDRAAAAEHRSVSFTVWDTDDTAREWLRRLRLSFAGAPRLGALQLGVVAAVDYSGAGARSGPGVDLVAPAVGVTARYPVGGFELIAMARREPVPLTAEVSEFLDPSRPSSLTYDWVDDGDGVPEAGERGRLLARDGGRSHVEGGSLTRSGSNQLALGVIPPRLGPVRLRLTGLLHVIDHPYSVRFAGPAASSWVRGTVGDYSTAAAVGATLRSNDPASPIYARQYGSDGQELYVLDNVERPAWYAGAEVQASLDTGLWFATLSATGYVSYGTTPFGVFPDRNDIGVIDASTADPNSRLRSRGSVDAGRAYHLKLVAGARPLDGLSAALLARYQDGEPITRLIVVEGLPQGPTAVMAERRGDPIPRLTFHMTVDARVRYRLPLAALDVDLVADGFNLLGSGTEIGEDFSTSANWRRSTEMVPGRAFLLSLEGAWR